MVIDYIDGHSLSDINLLSLSESRKSHFYEQLAAYYIQLRAHEFPHIGSLTLSDNVSRWAFDVPRRPLSMELNAQEIEGLQASNIVRKDSIFRSDKDYFTSLIGLAFNLFKRSQNSVFDNYDAEVALYNLYQFKDVVKDWTDLTYNDGPFVLDHGDLRPHNISVDDDLNIIGVIDWE
jgi:Phosphotransferase enzyme family